MPAPTLGGDLNVWGPMLNDFLLEVQSRLEAVETPQGPVPAYPTIKALLPDATKYLNAIAYVTDTKILVVSDGTVWRRQDTGAPV